MKCVIQKTKTGMAVASAIASREASVLDLANAPVN